MSQKSYDETAKLYLVPTHIGNIEDMTFRAIKVLKDAEVIFSEDTRVTGILLNQLNIKNKLISNYEYNEKENVNKVINYLENGKTVAIVSDAGTPIISDPGYLLAKTIIDKGYNVIALPGATAFVPALITSGLNPSPFLFYGFLNSKVTKRKKELEILKKIVYTIVLYESSHRIQETLKDILEIMGNRNISISREISKKYEEIYRGTCKEVMEELKTIKGEFVIVIEFMKDESNKNLDIQKEVEKLLLKGYKLMDAIKIVSKENYIPKSEVYNTYHKEK